LSFTIVQEIPSRQKSEYRPGVYKIDNFHDEMNKKIEMFFYYIII